MTIKRTVDYINNIRKINAAIVNVSGRQRMLSQRIALFSLRLVCSQDQETQLRQELHETIALMEKSHNGLIDGDSSLNLPGQPSAIVTAMYFEPPFNLNQQIHHYIAEVKALLQLDRAELTLENSHVQFILEAANYPLLTALDAVVGQYQNESDAEQTAIADQLLRLYEQSCQSAESAQTQAQQLEHTLSDLSRTQSQLVQTEKMSSLGQLVAGVAHEINNPVNFIFGNVAHANTYTQNLLKLLQLYQKHYPAPSLEIQTEIEAIDLDFLLQDLPKLLTSMKFGAERIQKIVRALRNFSRLDESEIKPVNIHEGIDSALMILQNRLEKTSEYSEIKVFKEYKELPLVECYAGQLNQVFMNILSNAIDALMPLRTSNALEGQVSPTIRVLTKRATDKTVQIIIADNGTGVLESAKNQLFEPFFTTKPVGQGTGLGLSISYHVVVEKHGGTLDYASAPGQGTEFRVEIPILCRPV